MCECNCDCEIDTSKPEDYEVDHGADWRQITHIYRKSKDKSGMPYALVFLDHDGFEYSRSVSRDKIRRKPKWQPEVGKWYLFSDKIERAGSANARVGRFSRKECGGGYIEIAPSGVEVVWKYCWPAGDLIELGE